MSKEQTDTDRLDWLEDHLLSLAHGQATSSVDMGGRNIHGRFLLRPPSCNANRFRVYHRSIRDAIDEAMGVARLAEGGQQ